MSDEMTVTEALENLDPAIDAHWTKDSLPNLSVIKMMTGHAVSRADAEAAMAELTRETARSRTAEPAPVDQQVDCQQVDFVSILDACEAAMTNNIRVYCEALYRTMLYYKAERENIVRQIENATAAQKVQIIGPKFPRSCMTPESRAEA